MKRVAYGRWLAFSAVTALCLLFLATARAQVAAVNDNFEDALVLVGATGSTNGNNLGATLQRPPEPLHNCLRPFDPGGSSVWYQWSAVGDGLVTFDTFGSDFDTVLAVYTGSDLGGLTQVACNDDSTGGLQSQVVFSASAGTVYYIAVDGFFASQGNILLSWRSGTGSPLRAGDFQFTTPIYLASENEFGGTLQGRMRSTPGARLTVTRVQGATGRVLVDYVITNGFYTNIVLAEFSGTNIFMTNETTLEYTNILSTNTVFSTNLQSFDYSTYVYRPSIRVGFSNFLVEVNGNIVEADGTNYGFDAPTNLCVNSLSVTNFSDTNAPPNVFTFVTNAFCIRQTFTSIVPSAVPGFDYLPSASSLTFNNYQMSADILVPVFYRFGGFTTNPADISVNRLVIANIVNTALDPLESGVIEPPTAVSFQNSALLNILDQDVVVFAGRGGTNIFNFERATIRCTEDVNGFTVARVGVTRTSLDYSQATSVPYRIDFLPNNNVNGHNQFRLAGNEIPLQAGSDYAQPTNPNGNVYAPDPDFESVEGTLNWGANDGDPKFIDIPIFDDNLVEFNEDLLLQLYFPNPQPMVTERSIGYLRHCVLTILFDEQPAGAADRDHNPDGDAEASEPPYNLHPGANGPVFAMAIQPDDKTIIGGNFTAYNSFPRFRLARMNVNGHLDQTFNPGSGADDFVTAIALDPAGNIIVGGAFNSINGTRRNGIARLLSNGALDASFNPGQGANDTVWSTSLQSDGRILISGEFTTVNGTNRNYIARLNSDGSLDTTFNPGLGPNDAVFAVAAQADGRVVIGGQFSMVGGVIRNGIARLNEDGSLDTTFDPGHGTDNAVYSLAIQPDGRILAAGAFKRMGLLSRKGVARLNPNGSVDNSFNPGDGTDDTVYNVVLQPDARILIGGIFTSYNETRRVGVARLLSNGSLDTSFMDTAFNQYAGLITRYYNPDIEPHDYVFAMGRQSDGNVMIGGGFTRIGGGSVRDGIRSRLNVARLIGGETSRAPGNIELAQNSYTADEFGEEIFVRMLRNNGNLGPASVTVSPTLLPPGPGAAASGSDFFFDFGVYGNPVWISSWPRPTWQLADGIWGQNNGFGLTVNPNGTLNTTVNDVFITILSNNIVDGDRMFNLELHRPNGTDIFFLGGENIPLGVALGAAEAPVTIHDDDVPPGVLTFTVGNFVVNENVTNAVVSVIRTNGTGGLVTVQYETGPGSASPGLDYLDRSGALSFPAGITNRTFLVPIVDNALVQDDRTINLRLFDVTGGASIALTNATITIVDNDFSAGRVNFSTTNYVIGENTGSATVTVTRTGGNLGILSVGFETFADTAVAGRDYTNVNGTLSWNSGETVPKTFTVPLTRNGLATGPLTIGLRLLNASISGALGSRSNAVVTITDQDALGGVQFSTDNFTYPENGGAATITVVRAGGSSESLQVNFAAQTFEAVGGFDFVVTNGTFIFGPGEVSKTFSVPLLNNTIQDGDRRVALVLTDGAPSGVIGFPDAAFLKIQDDESHNEPAGSRDTAFDPAGGFNGDVFAVVVQPDGKILAGGSFTAANTQIRNRLARLNSDGTLDTGFQDLMAGANDSVRALLITKNEGRIFIGGFFTQVNGVNRNHLARLNFNGALDTSFNPGAGTDNAILALTESFIGDERKILIGGDFLTYNSFSRSRLARLNENGTLDGSFNIGSGANGAIYAIAVSPTNSLHAGKILIGGDFTSFNGVPRNRIARLNPDGSVDVDFNPGTGANDSVRAIQIQSDGRILLGGLFTNVNGVTLNHVARLNPNGSLDTLFTPGAGANDAVLAIAVQGDTRILLGGQFTTASGVTRNRITRLNADGTVDPTINFGFGANSFVAAIALQTDNQIVIGGGFTEYDGEARSHLARLYGGAIGGSGVFEFTSANYQVDENGTNVLVSVRRRGGTSGAPNGDVFITLSTSNGTAIANTHYQPVAGSLAFPPGETFENVLIPVVDDLEINLDRTFSVNLSSPLPNVAGGPGLGNQPTALVTIINNDSAVQFSSPGFSTVENDPLGSAFVQVRRIGSSRGVASVDFVTTTNGTAQTGVDYLAVSNTVNFAEGETNQIVVIPIVNNALVQGNRTVAMELSNPINTLLLTPNQATLTIIDDDHGAGQLSFSVTNFMAAETAGEAIITVTRTNGVTGIATVKFSASGGTALPGSDYGATNGTLVFADGEASKSFAVRLLRNLLVTGDRTVSLTLSNVTGGATLVQPAEATLTIVDVDVGIRFSSPAYAALETSGSAIITVQRVGSTNNSVSVAYGTTNVSALAGTNYLAVAGVLNFAPGETFKTFNVPVLHEPQVGGNLIFLVGLANPSAGTQLAVPSTATVSVIDVDAGFSFGPFTNTVVETGTNILVPVIRSGSVFGQATVTFATGNGTASAGSDYAPRSGTLVFEDGEALKTISIPVLDDLAVEGNENLFVTLAGPSAGAQIINPSVAEIIVLDNDSGLRFSSGSYNVSEGAVNALITVLRSGTPLAVSNTVSLNFATSDGSANTGLDYLGTNGVLTFTNGQTAQSFLVPIIDDSVIEGDETANLTLSGVTGHASLLSPGSAVLTLLDNDGSLIVAAGTALTSESGPANGVIDPGETVSMLFGLRNTAGSDSANLTATLLAGNGVASPSGPQNYGMLEVGGPSVSRPFTFTANGTNGGTVQATLALTDNGFDLGTVVVAYRLGSATFSYTNGSTITIMDATNATPMRASPYPSSLTVTGLVGAVSKATVTFTNFNHSAPSDVQMLLVSPSEQRLTLMANAGGFNTVNRVALTFDDNAAGTLPAVITSGTYKPTTLGATVTFPSPAPSAPHGNTLATLNGTNPNGTWSLYVVDKATLDSGVITNGWILTLTVAGVVPAAADLSVTMTHEPESVVVTSNLTYTLTMTNHGPSPATGILLTNPLPAGLAFISAVPTAGSASTNAAGQLVWNLGGLAKDGTATLSVVTRSTAVGPLNLGANAGADESDPNPDNNVVSQVVNVSAASADLAVGVVGSPSPVSLGGTVTYTIGVTNFGPAVATVLGVTNQLPAGFNFISAVPAGYVVTGSSIAFTNIGDLGSGGTLAVSIVARPSTRGTFTNTVQIGSAIVVDPLKANNAASVKTEVEAPTMSLARVGNNLIISWSLGAGAYVLESTDSLLPPITWTEVTSPAPQIINGQRVVTVPIGAGNRYFRLRAPGL